MGFHLRKSFKVGAFRFNLSNSGLGFSVGPKGLRLGIDGKGRSYIAGGKGVLRYRQLISSGKDNKTTQKINEIELNDDLKIKKEYLPEELQGSPGWSFLIFISYLINSFMLLGLIVEPPKSDVFFGILIWMLFIASPLLKRNKVKRAKLVKKAIENYDKQEYETALNQFILLKSMVKNEKWLVREYISDCIYKCFISLNKFDSAINFLKTDKDIFQKEEKLINLYFALEKYKEVTEYYNEKKEMIKHLSDKISVETYNKIFESYKIINDYKNALIFLNENFVQNKRQKIVECYYKLENWEELILYLQKSYGIQEREEHPVYYAMLGNAFLKQGKKEIALETMLQGPVKKRTMNAEMCAFRYTLGECYEAIGDRENALKQYNKVYAYDVNYEDIQKKS